MTGREKEGGTDRLEGRERYVEERETGRVNRREGRGDKLEG